MTEDEIDDTLHALAHRHRRRILDIVGGAPGIAVGAVARDFDVSRIAVMNHLAVLERAGLIISRREGTNRRLYLNVTPIRAIYERWTTDFSGQWAGHLLHIKRAAERAAGANGNSADD